MALKRDGSAPDDGPGHRRIHIAYPVRLGHDAPQVRGPDPGVLRA